MNAFAAVRLDEAIAKLDEAVRLLGHNDATRIPRDVLLHARGDLVAMRQLLELEAELLEAELLDRERAAILERADTERPSRLRVVK